MACRLQDPKGLLTSAELDECQAKLSECLGKMARSTEKGGNPFFFALAATKYHFIEDNLGIKGWETAATDGQVYYWHPKFIKALKVNDLRIVQMHESIHIACFHVERFEGKYIHLWRLATDFYVNSVIEKDYLDRGKISHNRAPNTEHPIWKGELGSPITLQEVLDRIKMYHERPQDFMNEKVDKKEKRVCADVSLYGQSADDIYKKLLDQRKKYPPPEGECIGIEFDENGDYEITADIEGLDSHIKLKVGKKEIIRQLMNAAESAKRMRGTVPSEIASQLKELQEPQLTWEDLCHQALNRVKETNGRLNNWTRFRRRGLPRGLYIPTKIDFNGKVLVLLDTSGSMSDEDIAYIVSQLKVVVGKSVCWVVPVDACPHWEAAVEVRQLEDLKRVKVVGRGGTVFDEFFRDYRKVMKDKGPFDLIIVGTDGGYGTIGQDLKPPCDVVWVHCNNYMGKPPFGFMAPLRKLTSSDE